MEDHGLQELSRLPVEANVPEVPAMDERLAVVERQLAKQTMLLKEIAVQQHNGLRVRVADFDIGFRSLVWLLIKIALASIPAMVMLFILGAIVMGGGLLGALFAGLMGS